MLPLTSTQDHDLHAVCTHSFNVKVFACDVKNGKDVIATKMLIQLQ